MYICFHLFLLVFPRLGIFYILKKKQGLLARRFFLTFNDF